MHPRPAAAATSRGAGRLLRFATVGGLCGAIQVGLLLLLAGAGAGALTANVIAYLLSAQVNFVLSDRVIWGDRRLRVTVAGLARRWLGFHASIAGTFLLNQAVFVVARGVVPDAAAAIAGIGVSGLVNFAIQDRLTFRGA